MADLEAVQLPPLLGLRGALTAVGADRDRRDAALLERAQLIRQALVVAAALRAVEPAEEHHHGEGLGPLIGELPRFAVEGRDLERRHGLGGLQHGLSLAVSGFAR
jgi:hypothetical protein